MQLNCPVVIEQCENGFLVRPLQREGPSPVGREGSRVAYDLTALVAWLSQHFRRSVCPRCKKVASRHAYHDFRKGITVVCCDTCRLFAAEGWDKNWLSLDPKYSDESAVTIEEMAAEVRRKELELRPSVSY